ncbi:DUF1442 domain-containing protein, partial [Cephalotus follicularis]
YPTVIATNIDVAVASRQTNGRRVYVIPDERSQSEYIQAMSEAGMSSEVIVCEPETVMDGLNGIDFLVVDNRRKDFARVVRLAKLSNRGAVLVWKNAKSRSAFGFVWRSVVEGGSRGLV